MPVSPPICTPTSNSHRGDVRDDGALRRALDGVSVVYHFAALTGVGQGNYDIRDYVDVNVSGTATLMEVILKDRLPVGRLVLSSSRAVYGEGTHRCAEHGIVYPPTRDRARLEQGRFDVPCPVCGRAAEAVPTAEDRPLHPISVYGWTKKVQEEQCQLAADTFGLSVAILRYFNVYGSRQSLRNPYTGIISIFLARLIAGKPIVLYERGEPLRDFVHVSDVASANIAAGEADLVSCTPVNIGTGKALSVVELAHALAKAADKALATEDCGEFRVGDIHACYADLGRAHDMLGYMPETDLEAGLRETVDWALRHESVDLYDEAVDALRRFGLFGQVRAASNS